MTDKSFVTLQQERCVVCGTDFDTGALLIHKRMREVFDHKTVTGMGLCPEHQAKYDEGYIALVGVDPDKSGAFSGSQTLKPGEAYRTGRLAHVRASAWPNIFSSPFPEKDGQMLAMVFIEDAGIDRLAAMMPPDPPVFEASGG